MVKVVGIDPGTKSFDFCGLDDGRVFMDTTIPSIEIAKDPKVVIDLLRSAGKLDLIVGPSGYGLPLTHISQITDREHFLTILVRPDDLKVGVLIGLRKLVRMMKDEGFNVYFIPGVIHLPTVPLHRKVNKIDMGTADKLCCTVLAIYDQAKRLGISYRETSLILVEIGFGFTAIIGVENGEVVDGIGGTTGGIGFLTLGAMDGELAYLLNTFDKELLFQGGAAYIASGDGSITPEEFADKVVLGGRYKVAWEALMENIVKGVAAIKASVPNPKEILISGRLSRVDKIYDEVSKRLSKFGTVRKVGRFAVVAKEAAEGAALIADGLAGGRFKDLVDTVRIREASGTVLDYIYLKNIDEVKRKYGVI
ncbi:MAG: DUF1464 family protein [Nitrososphaerota archaeon]|nr:DUF1464 family protein [Nitrososphaerales archaeon]MDW8045296.1 DUF1464 family protein [Nitrososphaerota archaeon]